MVRANDTLSLTSSEFRALQRNTPVAAGAATTTRHHNLALILSLLHAHGALTRPQLVRRSGLSAPTVAALVAEAIEADTVIDLGIVAEAKVGKPASRVQINATGIACAVIDVTPNAEFVATLLNLNGEILWSHRVQASDLRGEEALNQVVELAKTALAAATKQVLGIAIASPGLVDNQGRVLVADRLGWRDVALAKIVERATSTPTVIGNDVNLMALGICRFQEQAKRDLVVITIDNGIGAAVVIGGDVVQGEQFAAGEIGHITVDPEGEPCVCGRVGCLDVLASAPHLSARITGMSEQARDAELARAGDAVGAFLAPILSILNMTRVALVGPAVLLRGGFEDAVIGAIRGRNRPAMAQGITLEAHSDPERLVALGAVSAVLESGLGVR